METNTEDKTHKLKTNVGELKTKDSMENEQK